MGLFGSKSVSANFTRIIGNVRIYTLNNHEWNRFVYAMGRLALIVDHDAIMVKTGGTVDVHVVGLETKSAFIGEGWKILMSKRCP
jgi:hypothetical protein